MDKMTSRFTRRCCTTDKYRVPLLDGQEVYFVEASHDAFRLERNTSIPDAYFGYAINRLGEFENLGLDPAEIKTKLVRLEYLEKKWRDISGEFV